MTQNRKTTGTLCVWGGEPVEMVEQATQVPVVHSVSFGYPDVDTWLQVAKGEQPGHIYSRNTNPTVKAFEDKVRLLEGAEAATSAATGMGIISSTLFALLCPGDRVVSVKDTYGGTNKLFTEFLPRYNVDVTLCDTTDHEAIEAAVAKGCRLLYLESPTNPTVKVVDIARLAAAGKRVGATVVVDNTFATPINQNPLELGADLVLHSATKYLGGHHDVTAGFVCTGSPLARRIWTYRKIFGGVMDPLSAFLTLRGLKTLDLRIRQHNQNAMTIARYLERHPRVNAVYYPGLDAHPDHAVAEKRMQGFGGMLSFEVDSDFEGTKRVMDRLKTIKLATSLGGVTSLANQPITNTHAALSAEARAKAGVKENLVRLSVGVESVNTLVEDLSQALNQA